MSYGFYLPRFPRDYRTNPRSYNGESVMGDPGSGGGSATTANPWDVPWMDDPFCDEFAGSTLDPRWRVGGIDSTSAAQIDRLVVNDGIELINATYPAYTLSALGASCPWTPPAEDFEYWIHGTCVNGMTNSAASSAVGIGFFTANTLIQVEFASYDMWVGWSALYTVQRSFTNSPPHPFPATYVTNPLVTTMPISWDLYLCLGQAGGTGYLGCNILPAFPRIVWTGSLAGVVGLGLFLSGDISPAVHHALDPVAKIHWLRRRDTSKPIVLA